MWLFYDYNCGEQALFTDETKANQFVKEYLHYAIDMDWELEEGEDWSLMYIDCIDKTFDEWLNDINN